MSKIKTMSMQGGFIKNFHTYVYKFTVAMKPVADCNHLDV